MPDIPPLKPTQPTAAPAPVAAPPLPPAPAAPAAPGVAPDAWVGTPLQATNRDPRASRRGEWDDLVFVVGSFGMSLPLAGAGALLGLLNPVAGAVGALVGGSLIGLWGSTSEIWAGTRPGAPPPRWRMIGTGLIPTAVTAIGAGIGFAVAGTASAVMWGGLAAAALPFALVWGTVIVNRLRNLDQPPPAEPVVPAPEPQP